MDDIHVGRRAFPLILGPLQLKLLKENRTVHGFASLEPKMWEHKLERLLPRVSLGE